MRLFIAEKPSLGKAIAEGLGIKKKNRSYIECDSGDVVTWCIGHVLEQAEPEEYDAGLKEWKLDNLPIFPKNWRLNPKLETKEQLDVILNLMKDASVIVNAGDPDREGNLLVNEVIEYAGKDPAKAERVLINDLNPKSVEKALSNLESNSLHINSSNAALGRSRADWLLGMNMTRACTVLAKQRGHVQLFSIGRVQTPTLGLVVKRDNEIKNFKPIDFYDVNAHFEHDGIAFSAKWKTEDKRCLDKAKAEAVALAITDQAATVVTGETKRVKSKQPLPFSMRTLQETLSAQYGFTAQQTLDLAQSLYEKHKLTSYPRTDQPYLGSDKRSEVETIIEGLKGLTDSPLGALAEKADTSIESPCWNDKKLEGAAHTAIIPTITKPDLSGLSENELKAYTAIASRYIAQFYTVAEDDNTTIELTCGDHAFHTSGKVEKVKGWREVLGKKQESGGQSLPALDKDQQLPCQKGEVVTKKTTPPKPFTEGTLLTAMSTIAKEVTDPAYKAKLKDTAGLGTEATRAGIIETLKTRGYIETKGKTIVSTNRGKMLINALPTAIKDPALTAIWEQQLDVIEKGEYALDAFQEKMEGFIQSLLTNFKNGTEKFNLPTPNLPHCTQKDCSGWINPTISAKGKAIHRCSHCDLRYRDSKGKPCKPMLKIGKLEV